jgi:hypothetical protein
MESKESGESSESRVRDSAAAIPSPLRERVRVRVKAIRHAFPPCDNTTTIDERH